MNLTALMRHTLDMFSVPPVDWAYLVFVSVLSTALLLIPETPQVLLSFALFN